MYQFFMNQYKILQNYGIMKMLSYDVVFVENVSVPKKQRTLFIELFSLSLASFFSFLNLVIKLAHWTRFWFFILLYTSELPIYKKCQYQRNSELGLFHSFRIHLLFFFFFFFFFCHFQIWLINCPIEQEFYFLLFYIHMSYSKKIKYKHNKLIQYFHNCWGVNSLLAKRK